MMGWVSRKGEGSNDEENGHLMGRRERKKGRMLHTLPERRDVLMYQKGIGNGRVAKKGSGGNKNTV